MDLTALAGALNGTWDETTLRVRVGRAWSQPGVPIWVPPLTLFLLVGALLVWSTGTVFPGQGGLFWLWNVALVVLVPWSVLGGVPMPARFNIEAGEQGLQLRSLHPVWAMLRREPTGWKIGRVESVVVPWEAVGRVQHAPSTLHRREGITFTLEDREVTLVSDGEASEALGALATWLHHRAGR